MRQEDLGTTTDEAPQVPQANHHARIYLLELHQNRTDERVGVRDHNVCEIASIRAENSSHRTEKNLRDRAESVDGEICVTILAVSGRIRMKPTMILWFYEAQNAISGQFIRFGWLERVVTATTPPRTVTLH